MRITERSRSNGAVTLAVEGRIVADWGPFLEQACAELLREHQRVDLDLSGVLYVDRSGLTVLRRLLSADVRLVGCPPLILELIEQDGAA
jgi:anti-anti-sigma regulatory factor